MLARQFKVSLEFTLDIDELTDEIVHRSLEHFSNYTQAVDDPATWEHVAHQRQLLRALLANETVLQRFLRNKAIDLLSGYTGELVEEQFGPHQDEEEILWPVIHQLDRNAAAGFDEAIEQELYAESTRQFSECFQLKLVKASISETGPSQNGARTNGRSS